MKKMHAKQCSGHRCCITLVLILGALSLATAQTADPGFAAFIGEWQGLGRFYNIDFAEEVGDLPMTIEIDSVYHITGNLGGATLYEAELILDDWNHGYMIKGKLQGQMFPGNDFHKRRLILMMKAPVMEQIDGADFHLRSNYTFDLLMRQGDITLKRVP